MSRFLIIGFLFLSTLGHAQVDSFLKSPGVKTEGHAIEGIDFIYMINLDQRPEKYQRSLEELRSFGIVPYRFSAVNGWEISLQNLDKLGVKYKERMNKGLMGTFYPPEANGEPRHEEITVVGRRYFSHCLSRGAIGIVLSHLSVLQDALNSGYQTIWVMEDDIEVVRDPRSISLLIRKLDKLVGRKGWDILFTDQDTRNQMGEYVPCRSYAKRPNYSPANPERFAKRRDVSNEFRKIGARYGAYSMIVRRSGMWKILSFIKQYKIFLPYDMEFYLPENVRMYTVRRDVVTTYQNALSDNGAPRY